MSGISKPNVFLAPLFHCGSGMAGQGAQGGSSAARPPQDPGASLAAALLAAVARRQQQQELVRMARAPGPSLAEVLKPEVLAPLLQDPEVGRACTCAAAAVIVLRLAVLWVACMWLFAAPLYGALEECLGSRLRRKPALLCSLLPKAAAGCQTIHLSWQPACTL
jgi:hypothetical protein